MKRPSRGYRLALLLVLVTLAVMAFAVIFVLRSRSPSWQSFTPVDRFTDSDGLRVHYQTYGKDREALVFVHGWADDLTFWSLQISAFDGCCLILVDLPGHGESDKRQITYSQDLFARAVNAVVQAEGVDNLVLVGHSMGTPVILQFYRGYPDQTLALVIVDGTWEPLGAWPQPSRPDYGRFVSSWIDTQFAPETLLEVREEVRAKMLRTPQHVMISALESTNAPEVWRMAPVRTAILAVYR